MRLAHATLQFVVEELRLESQPVSVRTPLDRSREIYRMLVGIKRLAAMKRRVT
jgi:hypothetical protein